LILAILTASHEERKINGFRWTQCYFERMRISGIQFTREIVMSEENSGFAKDYSENNFWDKVKSFASVAGKEVIDKALQLYYTMQAPATPTWARAVIIAALGYFISPVDAIPDIVPVVGYADDLGVLVAAIATVATYITDEMKAKAEAKLFEWFGS
jgi:uncharacterized membrane protein YkvA (DUF1232 family)